MTEVIQVKDLACKLVVHHYLGQDGVVFVIFNGDQLRELNNTMFSLFEVFFFKLQSRNILAEMGGCVKGCSMK